MAGGVNGWAARIAALAVLGLSASAAQAFGWPARSLAGLKAGDYTVQAVLNRYETFHRADGAVLKLPPDMGEGQQWNAKPGNLYSTPVKVHIDPAHPKPIALSLANKIPAIADKPDTAYIKHIRIKTAPAGADLTSWRY